MFHEHHYIEVQNFLLVSRDTEGYGSRLICNETAIFIVLPWKRYAYYGMEQWGCFWCLIPDILVGIATPGLKIKKRESEREGYAI